MNIKSTFTASAVVAMLSAAALADAQVYTFTATLKTTVAARGKVKASTLTCLDESETLVYRKQGSVKLQGLIWGCSCESLAEVSGWAGEGEDGCAFWDASAKQLLSGNFEWKLLNRIDSTAKKAEGAWIYEADCYSLVGGGFGTVKTGKVKDEDGETYETFYLASLSGNVAGWKCAPGYTYKTGKYIPCTFCNPGSEESEETVTAEAWSLCDCGEGGDWTAVSGTWKLKYEKKATAKLNKSTSIFDAYSFPSYVKSALQALDL